MSQSVSSPLTLETQQRSSPSMPHPKPTPKPGRPPSASKEVVSLGRRDVFKNSGAGRPDTFKERPTTTKALILRNGKHGAMGTGEVALLSSKIGGREKLDLLAGMRLRPKQYNRNRNLNLDARSPLAQRITPQGQQERSRPRSGWKNAPKSPSLNLMVPNPYPRRVAFFVQN